MKWQPLGSNKPRRLQLLKEIWLEWCDVQVLQPERLTVILPQFAASAGSLMHKLLQQQHPQNPAEIAEGRCIEQVSSVPARPRRHGHRTPLLLRLLLTEATPPSRLTCLAAARRTKLWLPQASRRERAGRLVSE